MTDEDLHLCISITMELRLNNYTLLPVVLHLMVDNSARCIHLKFDPGTIRTSVHNSTSFQKMAVSQSSGVVRHLDTLINRCI